MKNKLLSFLNNISSLCKSAIHSQHARRITLYIILSVTCILICAICIVFSNMDAITIQQSTILYILYFVILLMFTFTIFLWKNLRKLWKNRAKTGSMLQLRLISIFSGLAVVPSFLMILFTAIFFHKGIESWFNARNQSILREALHVSKAYLKEHENSLKNDGLGVARAIELTFVGLTPSQVYDENFLHTSVGNLMDELFNLKDIYGGILFEKNGTTIARSKLSLSLDFAVITEDNRETATRDGVCIIDSPEENKILSLFHLTVPLKEGLFLLLEKRVDPQVVNYVRKTQSAYSDYNELQDYRYRLEMAFIFIFIIFAILLVFSSISVAISLSEQLLDPISNLIDIAEKIKQGDLSARVEKIPSTSELHLLTTTFNEMIEQVQQQQVALSAANTQLDEKIQFITNVLSGVHSGVIGLDQNFTINVYNDNACEKIGETIQYGTSVSDIFPQISSSFSELQSKDYIETQFEFRKKHTQRLFTMKIAALRSSQSFLGYILTFDDITDLVATQRKAAWADVARRVAHEIKNPLTPIQLAAERIFRKYSKQINEEPETFKKLVDVIVKQVSDIRRLIDEFSLFARLPEPSFNLNNIFETIQQAVFFMQNAYPEVQFQITKNHQETVILSDDRLLHQAIVNILQNSINAMKHASLAKEAKILLSIEENNKYIQIKIDDNGPGLPKIDREKLTDPYFTLTPKGSGLGLSIVKKIIQDHGGDISFEDNDMLGARVVLSLPKLQIKGENNG